MNRVFFKRNALKRRCSQTGLKPRELLSSFLVGRSTFPLEIVTLSSLHFSTHHLHELHARMIPVKRTLTLK